MARMRLVVTLALAAALSGPALGAEPVKATSAAETARPLFDEYWEWVMREYPTYATFLGDHRYDDRLTDSSPEAVARRKAFFPAFLRRLDQVDGKELSADDRTSLEVLKFRIERRIAIDKLFGSAPFSDLDSWAPVTQMDGIHHDLPELVKATRFTTLKDYENYIKRLEAVPLEIRHLIERMQIALAGGWVLPKIAIARVPQQLEAQTDPDPEKSPEYAPFKSLPADFAPADRERLASAGRQVIRDKVIPAFRSLKAFYEERYLPGARDGIAISGLPGGPALLPGAAGRRDDHGADPTGNPRSRSAGSGPHRRSHGRDHAGHGIQGHPRRVPAVPHYRPALLLHRARSHAGGISRHRQAGRCRATQAVRAVAAPALRHPGDAPGGRRQLRALHARRRRRQPGRVFRGQHQQPQDAAQVVDGNDAAARGRPRSSSADRAGAGNRQPAAVSPQPRIHCVFGRLGAVCREPR